MQPRHGQEILFALLTGGSIAAAPPLSKVAKQIVDHSHEVWLSQQIVFWHHFCQFDVVTQDLLQYSN